MHVCVFICVCVRAQGVKEGKRTITENSGVWRMKQAKPVVESEELI